MIGCGTKACEDDAVKGMKYKSMKAMMMTSALVVTLLTLLPVRATDGVESKNDDFQEAVDKSLVRAGENRAELEKALTGVPAEQRKAMRFLIAYMPESDCRTVGCYCQCGSLSAGGHAARVVVRHH